MAFLGVIDFLVSKEEGGWGGILWMERREVVGGEADLRPEMETISAGATALVESTGIFRTHGLLAPATAIGGTMDTAPELPERPSIVAVAKDFAI